MKTKTLHNALLSMAAVTVALLSGCGTSSGYKQADKTGANIAAFRDELARGGTAIDATVNSLGQITATAGSDPRPAFTQYSRNVSSLESVAGKVRQRAQAMREAGEAYFNQWDQEVAAMRNPEIRDLAAKRRARLQEAFKKINARTEPLKEQFDPWMSDLKDLQRFLNNDLTVEGVNAAKGMLSKASGEGAEIRKALDALVAELNSVNATFTAAKIEKK